MNREDLPLAMTVRDVAKLLHIGINKAYDITKSPGFPSIKLGARIIILRDELFQWIREETTQSR